MKRFALFQGEKYSNRKQTLVAGGICSCRENCWQETRQQHVARFEDHLFPLKNARMLRCAVGEARETGWSWPGIFLQTQKWPFKNRDPPTGMGPTTLPSKIRGLMVTILPVWPENEKMFSSYRLMKKVVTGQQMPLRCWTWISWGFVSVACQSNPSR